MKERELALLRDRTLPMEDFRKASLSLSYSMASEIRATIQKNQGVVLVAILRAGLVLLPAFQEHFPGSPIGLIGIQREEKSAIPHLYYENIPPLSPHQQVLVLDPMLATGGSANLALDLLFQRGAKKCTVIAVLAAPIGAALLKKNHPTVSLYTVAMDQGLDAQKFIVPGLGDFGDRYFGTGLDQKRQA